LFQVRKLRREAEVETHTSGLVGSKLKVETFETSAIFQVKEESESSGGGATMTIGSSTVKDLDHWDPCLDNYKSVQEEIRSGSSDLSARANIFWIPRKVHEA
jgi:hypothetical protein